MKHWTVVGKYRTRILLLTKCSPKYITYESAESLGVVTITRAGLRAGEAVCTGGGPSLRSPLIKFLIPIANDIYVLMIRSHFSLLPHTPNHFIIVT